MFAVIGESLGAGNGSEKNRRRMIGLIVILILMALGLGSALIYILLKNKYQLNISSTNDKPDDCKNDGSKLFSIQHIQYKLFDFTEVQKASGKVIQLYLIVL